MMEFESECGGTLCLVPVSITCFLKSWSVPQFDQVLRSLNKTVWKCSEHPTRESDASLDGLVMTQKKKCFLVVLGQVHCCSTFLESFFHLQVFLQVFIWFHLAFDFGKSASNKLVENSCNFHDDDSF